MTTPPANSPANQPPAHPGRTTPATTHAGAGRPPNILLLFCDQFRYDAMGCAGNPVVKTPSLDRLAREGIHFTHGLTPTPVCIAARQSLLTGHYAGTHGRFANNVASPEPLLYTIPQLLGSAGYVTHVVGKMHFRPPRRAYGFQRLELMEEIPLHREDDEYLLYLKAHGYGHVRQVHGVRNLLYHQPQTSVIPEEHHGSTWVADRTIDFLTRHARHYSNRPFFLWSSWIAPHLPWNAPEPFASMYPIESIDPPHHWDQPCETLPPSLRTGKISADVEFASLDHLKRIKALYYGNVSLIDKGVGRILRALDALGMAGNTLVVFTSDHGEMMGDHGLFQKSKPYEASTRVPFLLRFPGRLEAGRRSDERVNLRDLMPTFLDAAGVTYPGQPALPGRSLLGRPGGGLAEPREYAFVDEGQGNNRWWSVMRGPWKYSYYVQGGWEELFNLEDDPQEMRNLLLGDPSADARALGDAMHRRLVAYERVAGFPSSFTADGDLISVAAGAVRRPDGAGGRATGRPPATNAQFPTWVQNLPPDELAQMESPGESVMNAIRREWTFTLKDLNLAFYKSAGGTLEGVPEQQLLEELDVPSREGERAGT